MWTWTSHVPDMAAQENNKGTKSDSSIVQDLSQLRDILPSYKGSQVGCLIWNVKKITSAICIRNNYTTSHSSQSAQILSNKCCCCWFLFFFLFFLFCCGELVGKYLVKSSTRLIVIFGFQYEIHSTGPTSLASTWISSFNCRNHIKVCQTKEIWEER